MNTPYQRPHATSRAFVASLKLHLRGAKRVISNFTNALQRHDFLCNLTPFSRLCELPYTSVFFFRYLLCQLRTHHE